MSSLLAGSGREALRSHFEIKPFQRLQLERLQAMEAGQWKQIEL